MQPDLHIVEHPPESSIVYLEKAALLTLAGQLPQCWPQVGKVWVVEHHGLVCRSDLRNNTPLLWVKVESVERSQWRTRWDKIRDI